MFPQSGSYAWFSQEVTSVFYFLLKVGENENVPVEKQFRHCSSSRRCSTSRYTNSSLEHLSTALSDRIKLTFLCVKLEQGK